MANPRTLRSLRNEAVLRLGRGPGDLRVAHWDIAMVNGAASFYSLSMYADADSEIGDVLDLY